MLLTDLFPAEYVCAHTRISVGFFFFDNEACGSYCFERDMVSYLSIKPHTSSRKVHMMQYIFGLSSLVNRTYSG